MKDIARSILAVGCFSVAAWLVVYSNGAGDCLIAILVLVGLGAAFSNERTT